MNDNNKREEREKSKRMNQSSGSQADRRGEMRKEAHKIFYDLRRISSTRRKRKMSVGDSKMP